MKKVLTIIFDGFGLREETHGNAIKLAKPNNFDEIWRKYPHSSLYASEEYIGLEKGQFGNSEIGHMTIGAGRKLKQSLTRIQDFIKEDLETNETFQTFINTTKSSKNKLHIMGLYSPGKVHSDMAYINDLYTYFVEHGIENIYFHLITDGRDTSVTSARAYIKELETILNEKKVGKIATICGRYYAMDRDKKWNRTKMYYDLLTSGIGYFANDIDETIYAYYKKGITDEFLMPIVIDKHGLIEDGDTILWMNYRTDRAKQILETFTNAKFAEFPIKNYDQLKVYSLLPIDTNIKTISFLDEGKVENPLGIYLSKLGLTQARVAETEKYAHVTYFFDGTYNGNLEGVSKFLIPSPKVETYDLIPQMSAVEVTRKVVECMEKDYDFILVNYANPDMVGHTGNLEATIKAIMTVDICLGKLMEVAADNFYKIILLADHGNADIMLDDENHPVTTHTLSKVPFVIMDEKVKLKESGDLTQVAPTILEYMDIAIPKEMKETETLFKKE